MKLKSIIKNNKNTITHIKYKQDGGDNNRRLEANFIKINFNKQTNKQTNKEHFCIILTYFHLHQEETNTIR